MAPQNDDELVQAMSLHTERNKVQTAALMLIDAINAPSLKAVYPNGLPANFIALKNAAALACGFPPEALDKAA